MDVLCQHFIDVEAGVSNRVIPITDRKEARNLQIVKATLLQRGTTTVEGTAYQLMIIHLAVSLRRFFDHLPANRLIGGDAVNASIHIIVQFNCIRDIFQRVMTNRRKTNLYVICHGDGVVAVALHIMAIGSETNDTLCFHLPCDGFKSRHLFNTAFP